MLIRRVDDNQKMITSIFRKLGFSVFVTSSLGKGFPDLVVGKNGHNHLVEIKDGTKPPCQQKLTPCEANFFATWKGSVIIVNSPEDVIKLNTELCI